ncbi:MAG: hypothetical protein ACLFTR_00655 [Candidatus Woesearchaeota archaeon]
MTAKTTKKKSSDKKADQHRIHPRGSTGKRQLSHDQEFEIMKLVLDKFLWVGLGVMVYGIWRLVTGGLDALTQGLAFVLVGAIVLMLFMYLLVKEFEFIQ